MAEEALLVCLLDTSEVAFYQIAAGEVAKDHPPLELAHCGILDLDSLASRLCIASKYGSFNL